MLKKIGLMSILVITLMSAGVMSQDHSRYKFEMPDIEGNILMADRWIGIMGRDVEQSDLLPFKLKELSGVIITKIMDNSPASKTDLQRNDVILEYDHLRLMSWKALRRMVEETPIGRKVVLLVSHDGLVREAKVIVEKKAWEFEVPQFKKIIPNWLDKEETPKHEQDCLTLGIELQGLTTELRKYFGVSEDIGVLIARVEKDSVAEKSGLQVGDVIIRINQETIEEPSKVRDYVCEMKSSESLKMTVVRNRKEMVVHILPGSGKLDKT